MRLLYAIRIGSRGGSGQRQHGRGWQGLGCLGGGRAALLDLLDRPARVDRVRAAGGVAVGSAVAPGGVAGAVWAVGPVGDGVGALWVGLFPFVSMGLTCRRLNEKGNEGEDAMRIKGIIKGREVDSAICSTYPRTPVLILMMHRRRRPHAAALVTAVAAVIAPPPPPRLGRVPDQPPPEPREYAPARGPGMPVVMMMVMPMPLAVAVATPTSHPLAALVVKPAVAIPARLLLLLDLCLQLREHRRRADESRPLYDASG